MKCNVDGFECVFCLPYFEIIAAVVQLGCCFSAPPCLQDAMKLRPGGIKSLSQDSLCHICPLCGNCTTSFAGHQNAQTPQSNTTKSVSCAQNCILCQLMCHLTLRAHSHRCSACSTPKSQRKQCSRPASSLLFCPI